MKRQRAELRERQKKWLEGTLARPGKNWSIPGASAANRTENVQTGTDEVIRAAGWGMPWTSDQMPDGISRRYPLARFESKERAETACEALRYRVSELARASFSKTRLEGVDELFTSANPQFFVVAETELAPGERITVREQIERLSDPKGNNPTIEEAVLRVFLPKVQGILDSSRVGEAAPSSAGTTGEPPAVDIESETPPAEPSEQCSDLRRPGSMRKEPSEDSFKAYCAYCIWNGNQTELAKMLSRELRRPISP